MTLEWDGVNLYRVEERARKRAHVGRVEQSVITPAVWHVYVRGIWKHSIDSEANARKQLENYAEGTSGNWDRAMSERAAIRQAKRERRAR